MTTLTSGSRIGGYEIVAPLRAGGMAAFYLARRVGPAGFMRPIGIKVVHTHLAQDRAFVDMFLDEARLSARIVHPNVVHVEELGESQGMFFLAMELVHGAPLSSLLRRLSETGRALTCEVACAIVMRVADGLHAAHQAVDDEGALLEVVHRDVSPQNILVGADGRVKLIDFGIAKARGRLQETEGGSLKGKLRYMSPEQAWGNAIDRRTDIYALGVVLWESLTGRRLFGGDSDVDALERVRAPQIPPPSALDDSLPGAVDEVLAKALAPDAIDRFDTAQAFRKAIGHACPGALTVEPDEIGALVRTLLPDELARERALLSSFDGAAPQPRADDEALATRTMHVAPQPMSDEPVAKIAATRVSIPRAPESKPPSRAPWIALPVVLALVAGVAWVEWPRPPADPCETVVPITAGDGARVVMPFDTRQGSSAFALRGMRNPAAAPMRSVAFSYVVPGSGPRTVTIDTAIEPTSPRFDTIVGVYRSACSAATLTDEPDVDLDDEEDFGEYRARGAIRAMGGDALTIVLSGYGGRVRGREDEGVGAIAIGATDPEGPSLASASVRIEGTVLHVEASGEDDDGDVSAARLRFEGRDGAPIAIVRFADPPDAPGAFTASGTLDIAGEGMRTMGSASTVEISLLDRAGNPSEPLEVPVTQVEEAPTTPEPTTSD